MRYSLSRFFLMSVVIASLATASLLAAGEQTIDLQELPGVGPISSNTLTMSNEQLEDFFEKQSKGTPIELTLDKGKVVDGVFSSYDDYYGTVWLTSHGGDGLLNQKGFRIAGIRNVALWDKEKPATMEQMGTSDYFLIKELDK
jgi:hypothetical protein